MDFHRRKYFDMYFDIAEVAAKQSVCNRHKVGAVVVTDTGMISMGYNGTPSGFDNACEAPKSTWLSNNSTIMKTKPETVHAEINALNKMIRSGTKTDNAVIFITRAPCFACAKSLLGLGLKAVYYSHIHDDMSGVHLLHKAGIDVAHINHRQEF